MSHTDNSDYWNKNIDKWSTLYSENHSDEVIEMPAWLLPFYRFFVMPMEADAMKLRYKMNISFINEYIKQDMVVVDVGCGTGTLTIKLLEHGAKVIALDFSEKAIEITKTNVEKFSNNINEASYICADITKTRLPSSDVVIAMGVTSYLSDLDAFFDNILPTTKLFYYSIHDTKHWANILRKLLPFIDVRHIYTFNKVQVDRLIEKYEFELIERQPFASGFIDIIQRKL
jgi:cyclopropane fatty-acyl-phospholipid synthase-like methyltransferase